MPGRPAMVLVGGEKLPDGIPFASRRLYQTVFYMSLTSLKFWSPFRINATRLFCGQILRCMGERQHRLLNW